MSLRYFAAFFAIYFVWGSTYLGVKVALAEIPPFVLSGSRYVFSGAILLLWAIFFQRAQMPTKKQFLNAVAVGCMLLALGNGLLTWGMQRVPSGMASIVTAIGPLLLVLISWGWGKAVRPRPIVFFALFLGMFGMLILSDANALKQLAHVRLWDVQVIVLACLFWNIASVYSTDADMPSNAFLMTGIEMLSGGTLQYFFALGDGEFSTFNPLSLHPTTYWAMLYLILAGGVWGFTSYVWLMRNAIPIQVAAHSFINPIVALLLGYLFLNETFTLQMFAASICLLTAVLLLLWTKFELAKFQKKT